MNATFSSAFDLPGLQGRLHVAELKVLTKYESKILAFIGKKWRGWVYAGRPLTGRNVSIKSWKSTVQSTETPYALNIWNDATTKGGDSYSGYVHRAGTSRDDLEYLNVAVAVAAQFNPLILRELLIEVNRAVTTERPMKRINRNTNGGVTRTTRTE